MSFRSKWLRLAALAGLLTWAFAVGAGLEVIFRYQTTAGVASQAPPVWPGSALVSPQGGQSTLLMFVHPRCTCSRASLTELKRVLERSGSAVSAWVLFFRPDGADDTWELTPTWAAAQGIPGVRVLIDRDGAEAARFGASTSGHLVLYSANGQLLFAGGITASRAHLGPNDGERSVIAQVAGRESALHEHPVYGCSFHELETRSAPRN